MGDVDERPDVVLIEIPADHRYVALTRVATASLATDLDPDVDDVEDLRVAVNEVVGLLVDAAEGRGVVRLELSTDDRTVRVRGRCEPPADGATPDALTQRILDATVDTCSIAAGTFELTKSFPTT